MKIRIAGLAALLLATVVVPASASTILFSNFGPGDSFSSGNAWLVGSLSLATSERQEVGSSFVAGIDATLDSIRLATKYFSRDNDFVAWLAADESGVPGAVLETFPNLVFSSSASILTLTSAVMPALSAGSTYWIVVSAPDLVGSAGGWNFNDQGALGLAFRSATTPTWTVSAGSPAPAFEVNGADIASPVPEPATLSLLGLGLGVAAARRRMNRR